MKLITMLLLMVAIATGQTIPGAVLAPVPWRTFVDANGRPLSGAKLYTCVVGTAWSYPAGCTSPLATFTSSAGPSGTANANPVVANAAGQAAVWIGPNPYKMILTDASGVVQWTADNVADQTFNYLHQITLVGSSSLISYVAPVTGGVTRTVFSRLAERISVLDFGAKCDATNDDGPAIQAAIAWARLSTPINGGTVYLPYGRCVTNQPIILYGRVDLIGVNSSATTLQAGPLFPTNSAVLTIGDITLDPAGAYHAMASDMTIVAASNAGSIGVQSGLAEEMSGLSRVSIIGYMAYGVKWLGIGGGGSQNWSMSDLWIYSNAAAASSECILISGSTSANPVTRVTCAGPVAAQQPGAGISISSANVTLKDIHVEQHKDGIAFGTYGGGTVTSYYGHSTVTNGIHISAATSGLTITNSFSNGGAINVLDDGMVQSIATAHVAFYATSSNVSTPLVLTTDYGTQSILHRLRLSLDLTIGPEATPAMRFQSLGAQTILTTSLPGMLMQSSSMPAGPVSGGLFLSGNGLYARADSAGIGAGFTTDLATYTARGTAPVGVSFGAATQGRISFFANTAATPGSVFTPNYMFGIGPRGVQFTPSNLDPGCTTGSQNGSLWIDNTTTTTATKLCTAVGGAYAWRNWPVTTATPYSATIAVKAGLSGFSCNLVYQNGVLISTTCP